MTNMNKCIISKTADFTKEDETVLWKNYKEVKYVIQLKATQLLQSNTVPKACALTAFKCRIQMQAKAM